MPTNCTHQRCKFGRRGQILVNHRRRDELRKHIPGRARCLRVVTGRFEGSDFAPSDCPIGNYFHQQNAAILHRSKAGLQRRFQACMNFTQCNGIRKRGGCRMPVASAIFQYDAAECWNRASAARITLLCPLLQGFPGPAMFQPVNVIGPKTLLSPKWK
jgi:hypothetical protein